MTDQQQIKNLLKKGYQVHNLRCCTSRGKNQRPIQCWLIVRGGSLCK